MKHSNVSVKGRRENNAERESEGTMANTEKEKWKTAEQ